MPRPDPIFDSDGEVRKHFPNLLCGNLELQGIFSSRKDAQAEIDIGLRIGAVGKHEILPRKGVLKYPNPDKPRDAFGAYIERW